MTIEIPKQFEEAVIRERGAAGRKWLDDLSTKISQYCDRWKLIVESSGMVHHGHLGVVLPVRRGDEVCVLKLTWVDEETKDEALALRTWNGNGAVKLLESDANEGVILLEALNTERTLGSVPIDEAVDISAKLLRRLAIPAPSGMLELQPYIERLSRIMDERWHRFGEPFDKNILDRTQEVIIKLAPSAANLIVNQDLHYDNVLAGTRESWLVIDPKVVTGDPEFGVAPLLWRRPEQAVDANGLTKRMDQIVQTAELDRKRALGWALMRTVEYWLWALEFGLTEDPKRCELIVSWLLTIRRDDM